MTRCLNIQPMKYFFISIFGFFCLVNAQNSLATVKPLFLTTPSTWWNPLLTISGGDAFSQNIESSHYFPSSDPTDENFYRYQASRSDVSAPVVGLFLATDIPLNSRLHTQIGLNYQDPFAFDAKGTVTQGLVMIDSGLPDALTESTFPYHYQISAQQWLVQAKLLYQWRQGIFPYLLAGFGTSYNRSFHFSVGISPPGTTMSNQFQNNGQWVFSYTIGLGLDLDVIEHWRVGLGYRFTDYGPSKTGNSILDRGGVNNNGLVNPEVTSPSHLSVSHLYSNELTAQVTYLFG